MPEFSKQGVIVAQNATQPAATIYAALVASGDVHGWDAGLFEDIHNTIFNSSQTVATAAEVIEVFGGPEDGKKSGGGNWGGGGNRGGGRSYGGNRSGGGGGQRSGPRPSEQEPGDLEFRTGKHAGETIRDIYNSDPDFLYWAQDNLQNAFMKAKVTEYLQSVEG